MISKILKDMKKKIITIEDFIDKEKSVLKSKTQRLTFPLSEEDKNIIILMKEILFALYGTLLGFGIITSVVSVGFPDPNKTLNDPEVRKRVANLFCTCFIFKSL
jgi:hypothetical protein